MKNEATVQHSPPTFTPLLTHLFSADDVDLTVFFDGERALRPAAMAFLRVYERSLNAFVDQLSLKPDRAFAEQVVEFDPIRTFARSGPPAYRAVLLLEKDATGVMAFHDNQIDSRLAEAAEVNVQAKQRVRLFHIELLATLRASLASPGIKRLIISACEQAILTQPVLGQLLGLALAQGDADLYTRLFQAWIGGTFENASAQHRSGAVYQDRGQAILPHAFAIGYRWACTHVTAQMRRFTPIHVAVLTGHIEEVRHAEQTLKHWARETLESKHRRAPLPEDPVWGGFLDQCPLSYAELSADTVARYQAHWLDHHFTAQVDVAFGMTPLALAAMRGSVPVVQHLLAQMRELAPDDVAFVGKITCRMQGGRGLSALEIAAQNGHAEVVSVLCDAGVRTAGTSALHCAVAAIRDISGARQARTIVQRLLRDVTSVDDVERAAGLRWRGQGVLLELAKAAYRLRAQAVAVAEGMEICDQLLRDFLEKGARPEQRQYGRWLKAESELNLPSFGAVLADRFPRDWQWLPELFKASCALSDDTTLQTQDAQQPPALRLPKEPRLMLITLAMSKAPSLVSASAADILRIAHRLQQRRMRSRRGDTRGRCEQFAHTFFSHFSPAQPRTQSPEIEPTELQSGGSPNAPG